MKKIFVCFKFILLLFLIFLLDNHLLMPIPCVAAMAREGHGGMLRNMICM